MSIIIDDVRYNVRISDDKVSSDVISKFAERTDDGILHQEVLGVYFNFELEFEPIRNPQLHNRFFMDLTAPIAERTVTLPGLLTTYTFRCYIRVDPVAIIRHKLSGNTYEAIKARFISIAPARRP